MKYLDVYINFMEKGKTFLEKEFIFVLMIVIFQTDIAAATNIYGETLPESMYFSDGGTMFLQGGDETNELYDITQLKTIYLTFSQEYWWQQLVNNYNTDTCIPADLTYEGVTYPGVGIRFRGNTSYTMVRNSQKKSFNISLDYTDPDQQLMGYQTLNLNNAHLDATMMCEVLYFNLFRKYAPCPKANFVKLVINDENWGVYVNVEQINADFIKEWFFSSDGDRWKISGSGNMDIHFWKTAEFPWPGGGGGFASGDKALMWLGSDVSEYEQNYILKTTNSENPWSSLIATCDVLNNVSLEVLPDTLDHYMDVDRWLWFLAVENVFADDDSYLNKGGDYQLYYEPETGRLHPIQHDGNETFGSRFTNLNPFDGDDNPNRPVISRLLSVPAYRQRYAAHIVTIVNEILDLTVLEPQIEEYRALIQDEVFADTKKLYSNSEFTSGITTLKNFITSRRNYLLNNNELKRISPDITEVCRISAAESALYDLSEQSMVVTAEIDGTISVIESYLYYSSELTGGFECTAMFDDGEHGDGAAGDSVWGGIIPDFPTGSFVRYYVEARVSDSAGTSAFSPPGAEHNVYYYTVPFTVADTKLLVINELMAVNNTTIHDSQGEYDDWIELKNLTDTEIDISGMYLSDSIAELRKWQFPEGTVIPESGYLIIWADDTDSEGDELHTNFKLSSEGETVFLVDTDEHSNRIVDVVIFSKQYGDISIGRYSSDDNLVKTLTSPTPGYENTIPTGICEDLQPQLFELHQNYPNPFNGVTTIQFTLSEPELTDLSIYNSLGQRVTTLIHENLSAGSYQISWKGCNENGSSLASGIYIYSLRAGELSLTKNLLLVR